jgi:glycine cleavage system transcriptional repressor
MHNRRMNAEVDDQYLVLSALGPDRPGLVSQVTRHLTEHGGNIEDSRMAVLETETGLKIITRPTKSPEAHRRATSIPVAITADAIDHEGIVNAVSTALHLLEVNIVSLETSSYNAPVTGSPLFRLVAKVDVPRDVTVPNLRKRLDEVAERLNIDIDVRAVVGR